eukprot:CAMPEP_0194033530 /NCGR_PEP_ID=MMETSP0009_2-20130614/6192_1 /TAXON_ID=210454 /ORGANISM="Grammatophora oceanica, Strain CCMP 410" /LENGTH=494 /DNA_ID=CAMNT_0038674243 /DNA_START=152 /DNA_END=1636 /DNA_ORIENTATION=+
MDDADSSSGKILGPSHSSGEVEACLSSDYKIVAISRSTSSDETMDTGKDEEKMSCRAMASGKDGNRLVPLLLGVATSVILIIGISFFAKNNGISVKANKQKHEDFQGSVTRAELAEHSTPEDCWLAIHGVVYDLTKYAPEHPGGSRVITDLAGTDATAEYDLEHPESLMRTIPETMIGDLVEDDGGHVASSEGEDVSEDLSDPLEPPVDEPSEDSSEGAPPAPPVDEKNTVFISEMHYRNAGSDQNQFIEIAYSSEMDVSAYQVFFARSSGAIYLSESLRNFETGESVGGLTFAFLNVPTFHNGPDGLAIVDANDNVVEFISYGGTIEGGVGILQGKLSTDIGIEEPDEAPINFSIQKGGPGCLSADFVWQDASIRTPGKRNSNMEVLCSGAAAPETAAPTTGCSGVHYSLGTIARHGSNDDCWQTIFGLVYDFTNWAEDHTGGADDILPHCGTDSTAAYLDRHPNAKLLEHVEDFLLGRLGDQDGTFPIPCER